MLNVIEVLASGLERTGLEHTGLEHTGLEHTGLEHTSLEHAGLIARQNEIGNLRMSVRCTRHLDHRKRERGPQQQLLGKVQKDHSADEDVEISRQRQ